MPDDYVKRSDVHKAFQPKYAPAINRTFAAMIDSVPAADVVEVRHGRWNLDGSCPLCGKHSLSTYGNFCCYCGADMRGEDVPESNTPLNSEGV